MTALRQLQLRFQQYVLHGAREIEPHIASPPARTSERLAVYADAYRLRLLEALTTDFIALHAHLGEEEFGTLGYAYIDAHPSGHPSLRHFGRQLSAFLATAAPYRERPWLAELAAFDWALTEAFDAADRPVLSPAALAAVAPTQWPAMRFTPHPSLQRLDLHWNAAAIWQAADSATVAPAPERSDPPVAWAIWRHELQTYFRSLPVDEAWALDALRSGETFGAICEGLCEWIDAAHVAPHAAGLLKQWLTDGLLCELDLD